MWDINRLQSYIDNQIEENIHLDYKAAGALGKTNEKKKDISKDISAFANSDGGIIIYGMKEKENMRHVPDSIDPIKRNDFSKETLEQIINTSITPKINGIIISPVVIGAPENNDVVYIVEIPKSDTAHQAVDKRYYKRYNFQSEAMEDWELKDILNRRDKGELFIWLEPSISKHYYTDFTKRAGYKVEYSVWVQNVGKRIVQHIEIYLIGDIEDADFFIDPTPVKEGKKFELSYSNNKDHKVKIEDEEFVVNSQPIPLLPKVSKIFGKLQVYSNFVMKEKEIKVLISTEDGRTAFTKTLDSLCIF